MSTAIEFFFYITVKNHIRADALAFKRATYKFFISLIETGSIEIEQVLKTCPWFRPQREADSECQGCHCVCV